MAVKYVYENVKETYGIVGCERHICKVLAIFTMQVDDNKTVEAQHKARIVIKKSVFLNYNIIFFTVKII